MTKKKKRGIIESIVLITSTVIAVTAAVLLFLFYTSTGRKFTSKVVAGYLHGAITYVSGEETDSSEIYEIPEEVLLEREEAGEQRKVYHVLLLGEEALKTTSGKGRTDAILLVTIHTGKKKIAVTSILRDSYVEPEGMQPCKINAVYGRQGVGGLYRILYEKLGVWPDGYAKVGFESFERIVDLLGGVKVTLTKEEAGYLNSHNYISKEQFRNVREGTQVLNGNQTLGYCRVRHVPNSNGTKYDYGRTERQRMVLRNLFERYKEAGVMKWAKLLKEMLGYIETDISQETLEKLIFAMYDNRIKTMEHFQVPAKGTFETPKAVGKVTSPLIVDWDENKKRLECFFEE